MQRVKGAKTKLAHNRRLLLIVAVLIIIGGYIIARTDKLFVDDNLKEHVTVNIGKSSFEFRIADEPAEWEKGLSGQEKLESSKGMLFIFSRLDRHCMWMKDMKFAIDILWFDEQKLLVHQEHNVSPDTFPKSFCSPEPAMYVVEVNSGVVLNAQVKQGDTLEFSR